ncbi:Nitroreductase family protein [Ligilactobacillus equi DSM 15833 = JCM 10991]|uniref:Nitroreductase family protein n=2 Tax=Ligilactobacillus equi TaxID=137357 RepID=A0A0R1TBV2_9LACO|nr:Nitroreductase family protein [Ligilactobacillus equi DSM 15833 = JCM 10991]
MTEKMKDDLMDKAAIQTAILKGTHFRRAIREYRAQAVSEADLNYILEVGRMSPSSIGLLDWRVLVFENDAKWDQVRQHAWGAQKSIEHAADKFIVFVAQKEVRYDQPAIQELFTSRGFNQAQMDKATARYRSFQLNDMEIPYDDARGFFDWAAKQTYIAMGMMMSAASAIGIDSCAIEGFNRAEVNQVLVEQGLIDSAKESACLMMSLGYRLNDPKRPQEKLSMDDFVKFVK